MKNLTAHVFLVSAGILFSGPCQSDTLGYIATAAANVDRNNPLAVMEIQGQLRSIGLYNGPIDGLFGRGTYQAAVDAVAAVNAAQGVSPESVASDITETSSANVYAIGAADSFGGTSAAPADPGGASASGGSASASAGSGAISGASGGASAASGLSVAPATDGGASVASGPGVAAAADGDAGVETLN